MLSRIRKSMADKDQGFTLIELLVVIIIIGILAAIAIPVFLNQRRKGIDAGVKSDIKNMATLQETAITDDAALVGVAYPETVVAPAVAKLDSFKPTTGNVTVVTVKAGVGYCIKGSNPNGSAAGGATGAFYWYDSANGGLFATASPGKPALATTCP